MGHFRYNNLETEQKKSVIQGHSGSLLGHSAIAALAIVSMVEPFMTLEEVAEKIP